MSNLRFDPINNVWLRVVPNVGLSVAEYDAELDAMAIECVRSSPQGQDFIARLAIEKANGERKKATVK